MNFQPARGVGDFYIVAKRINTFETGTVPGDERQGTLTSPEFPLTKNFMRTLPTRLLTRSLQQAGRVSRRSQPRAGNVWQSGFIRGWRLVAVVGAFLEGSFPVHEDAHVGVCVVQPPGTDSDGWLHASGVDGTVSEEYVEAVTRAVFSEDADFSVLAHGSPCAAGIVLNQTKNFAVMRETIGIVSRVCVAR